MAKRGKVPSLISGSNGKPVLAEAKQKRICHRCGRDILMREKLFEIPKPNSGFTNKQSNCKICFKEILDQTQKELNELMAMCIELR